MLFVGFVKCVACFSLNQTRMFPAPDCFQARMRVQLAEDVPDVVGHSINSPCSFSSGSRFLRGSTMAKPSEISLIGAVSTISSKALRIACLPKNKRV